MLFISLLKTKRNQLAREFDTFSEAWTCLNTWAENYGYDVVEGLILEEDDYLDNQMPDFNNCKVIASVRIIR